MSHKLGHLPDFWVIDIYQLLNKEFDSYKEYGNGTVKENSGGYLVSGAGQALVRRNDLNWRSFKPNHIVIANCSLLFHTHDIFQIDIAQRNMGVMRV